MIPVAPLLEGSWRYIGGGAIVFQAIKTYIFGKLVRYEDKIRCGVWRRIKM
jgi:hypothetical protein